MSLLGIAQVNLGVHLVILGLTLVYSCALWFTLVQSGLLGIIRLYSDSLRFSWLHLGSFGCCVPSELKCLIAKVLTAGSCSQVSWDSLTQICIGYTYINRSHVCSSLNAMSSVEPILPA